MNKKKKSSLATFTPLAGALGLAYSMLFRNISRQLNCYLDAQDSNSLTEKDSCDAPLLFFSAATLIVSVAAVNSAATLKNKLKNKK